MREYAPSAGIDYTVHLGQYECNFNVKTSAMTLHRFKDNLVIASYYHPYVSTTGRICFGNADATANKFLANGRIYDVFMLLASLLQTYTHDSGPYIALANFKKAMRAANPNSPVDDHHYCRDCDTECSDCGCGWCYDCDCHEEECDTCGSCGERHCDGANDCEYCETCGCDGDCEQALSKKKKKRRRRRRRKKSD